MLCFVCIVTGVNKYQYLPIIKIIKNTNSGANYESLLHKNNWCTLYGISKMRSRCTFFSLADEGRGSRVPGQSRIYKQFEFSLGYIKPYPKTKENRLK